MTSLVVACSPNSPIARGWQRISKQLRNHNQRRKIYIVRRAVYVLVGTSAWALPAMFLVFGLFFVF